ncbi:MAG: HTTM domain-containing protein, partial [Myxococcota bacterium]
MTRTRRWWRAWVALWDGVEHPRSLALVRLLLGLVILWDFVEIARLDLVVALFAGQPAGGLSDVATRTDPPWFVDLFGSSALAARGLHAAITFAAASFALGLFTRTSAVVLLLLWAQFARILPAGDRGIDTLCRDVLVIFVFARGGDWLSIDAVRRTGSFWGDGAPIPAWPRRLLILQIVAMYFLAGIQKGGVHWYPMGHFAALYFILQDPAIARIDFRWLAHPPWFQLTQLGSAVTILFQDTYPTVLWLRWLRATADRGGRLR